MFKVIGIMHSGGTAALSLLVLCVPILLKLSLRGNLHALPLWLQTAAAAVSFYSDLYGDDHDGA